MCPLVMSSFSLDLLQAQLAYWWYLQCFHTVYVFKYLHSAWFLDTKTSIA